MLDKVEDLLLQIKQINDSLFSQADAYLGGRPTHYCPTETSAGPVPSFQINLPSSSELTDLLVAAGAPISVAAELTSIHIERASELAERYTVIYQETCKELAQIWRPASIGAVSSLHTRIGRLQETYWNVISEWKEDLLNTVRLQFGGIVNDSSSTSIMDIGKNAQHAFNHDYVPKLEVFFEQNQFPSRADRAFLAKRSGMDLRQINVWFQNRRSRARKGGQDIRKKRDLHVSRYPRESKDEGFAREIRPLKPQPPGCLETHSDESTDVDESETTWSRSSSVTLVPDDHPFCSIAPCHAYPTIYPPAVDEDIFPCCSGNFTFPKPIWNRNPAIARSGSREGPNLDDLIAQLENLGISDENEVNTTGLDSQTASRPLSAADMQTYIFSAPLPALVVCRALDTSRKQVTERDVRYIKTSESVSAKRLNSTQPKWKKRSLAVRPPTSSGHLGEGFLGDDDSAGAAMHGARRDSISSVDSVPSLSFSSTSSSSSSSASPSPELCTSSLPTSEGKPSVEEPEVCFDFFFDSDHFKSYPLFTDPLSNSPFVGSL